MKVKCIKNKLADFEEGPLKESLKKIIHLDEDIDIGLEVGAVYTVYGISFSFSDGTLPYYYICDFENANYPVPNAAVFFEVVDPRPSQYWEFIFNCPYNKQEVGFNFPEWWRNEYFYSNLLDGEPKEEAIFLKYKKLMDEEFEVKTNDSEMTDKEMATLRLKLCRVCGTEVSDFYPWGEDGQTPSFEICDCCGTQFGYEDCETEEIKKRRANWLAGGARWLRPDKKPSGWTVEKSLARIPSDSK